MRYNCKLLILALALATVGAASYAADVATPEQSANREASTADRPVRNANITMAAARAIALKAQPGKIIDEELEKESGGSGLRYSFEIKLANGTQEVGVDAKTGQILENKLEGPNPD